MKIWNNPFRKILLFSLLLLSFSSAQAEENKKETLLFLPLDNRPVCSSYSSGLPFRLYEARYLWKRQS